MNVFALNVLILLGAIGAALLVPLWYLGRVLAWCPEPARSEIRKEMAAPVRRLWLGAAVATTVSASYLFFDAGAVAAGGRNGVVWGIAFACFHLLWWPLAMPLLVRQHRVAREKGAAADLRPSGARRVASLTPRRLSDYLPGRVRVLPWLLGAGSLAWFAVRWATLSTAPPAVAIALLVVGLVALSVHALWTRLEVSAPLGGTDPDHGAYRRSLDELRRFRVRGAFCLQLLLGLTLLALAGFQLEVAVGTVSPKMSGILGSCVGGSVGLFGAAFGTAASLQAQRLEILRAKTESS